MCPIHHDPPGYTTLQQQVRQLREEHPAARVFSIGKSVQGKNIYALGVGKLASPSLFVGGVGGGQWMTTLLLCRFYEALCAALEGGHPLAGIDVARALQNQSIVLIPCLNPDGVDINLGQGRPLLPQAVRQEAQWQANARGVDLRRNFSAGFTRWREEQNRTPGPWGYGGHRPFSEPESRAVAGACLSLRVRQLYLFETHGEDIRYRYENSAPARAQLMAQVLALSSGYRVVTAKEKDLWGGLMAWYIDRMRRPGFTFRVGRPVRGNPPLPTQELEPIYARLVEMMILAALI